MTPKEKAKELFDKFSFIETYDGLAIYDDELTINDIKKATLILIDELIDFENRMLDEWTRYFEGKGGQMKIERLYWEEVKAEIEKL